MARELTKHLSSELPEIECSASELNQVFMNILVNAIDALETKRSKLCSLNSVSEHLQHFKSF